MAESYDKTFDSNGKFARGCRGGPGRKPKPPHKRVQYLSIIMETCTPDKWREVCQKALQAALEGDEHARNWLANYLIGRPTQTVNVQSPDGGPLILNAIFPVLLKVIEKHPDVRDDMVGALEQLRMLPDSNSVGHADPASPGEGKS